MHIVLWRRLDTEGHDACRYFEMPDGWKIEGTAVFKHGDSAASLRYPLLCDSTWTSQSAVVSGWIAERRFDLNIEREADDQWRINGLLDADMAGLGDIDLGFIPASNTNAIQRLDLSEGAKAETVAVWLDNDDWSVKRLPPSYHRTGAHTFGYASPRHDYRATLVTDDFGAITEYPDLWIMDRSRCA